MAESVDIETFQQRLWQMFEHRFATALTQLQVDRVRWHRFPKSACRGSSVSSPTPGSTNPARSPMSFASCTWA